MYSLEQLRGFVAVAEELHYGRAAARLNMTQPPLSRQVQKLEHAIQVRLFDRGGRSVSLTPAGTAFLEEARRLLELAERAPDRARRISAGSMGTVRLGFTAASTYGLLGKLLTEVTQALPGLHIELREMVTREQLAALANGEIDLGLARPPVDRTLFGSRLLQRESMVAAVPENHPLAGLGRAVTAADLADVELIMHSPTGARYFYDLVTPLVSARPGFTHTVTQIQTMVSLVSAGLGVALVPQSATFLGIGGVQYLELTGLAEDPVELHAIWPLGLPNPAVDQVLAVIAGADPGDPAPAALR